MTKLYKPAKSLEQQCRSLKNMKTLTILTLYIYTVSAFIGCTWYTKAELKDKTTEQPKPLVQIDVTTKGEQLVCDYQHPYGHVNLCCQHNAKDITKQCQIASADGVSTKEEVTAWPKFDGVSDTYTGTPGSGGAGEWHTICSID